MKTILILTLAILLCGKVAIAQETKPTQQKPAEPAHKMLEFQMALMKRGPKWPAKHTPEQQQKHHEYVHSMLQSGKMMIAGGVKDDDKLIAVYIFRTKSADEARAWLADDPSVVAEHLVPELHPWWSEDVMNKNVTLPVKFTTAYLAFWFAATSGRRRKHPRLKPFKRRTSRTFSGSRT